MNTSYVFVPFVYEKNTQLRSIVAGLDACGGWSRVHDDIRYMFRYVADKLDSRAQKHCQCYHYMLTPQGADAAGLVLGDEGYATDAQPFRAGQVQFGFGIQSVQMYCFSTSVGILAFQLCFAQNDPDWIASAQYYLKKLSKQQICAGRSPERFTLLQKAKDVLQGVKQLCGAEFFYFANPGQERANFLTLLEVEPKESCERELYYLRNCFGDSFTWVKDPVRDERETYIASQDIRWGVSPEAAVCLISPVGERRAFVHGTFVPNFMAQYLFMYVLLLHQKYVLYLFLTQIGVGAHNDLEILESYKDRLYEFETDFVFSCITEVPQYQNLYSRLSAAFSLKEMYEDVHEPLLYLTETRRKASAQEQKKRDDIVNKALFVLPLLGVVSALVDGFDFVGSFGGWFADPAAVRYVQGGWVLAVLAISILVLRGLWASRKK